MSSKRDAIVDEATSWLGTPFLHQARVKHEGVDCAQFVLGVGINTGQWTEEQANSIKPYPENIHLTNDMSMILGYMEQFGCVAKAKNRKTYGDILVFQIGDSIAHIGILLEDNYMIHAIGRPVGRVTICGLQAQWAKRLFGCYRFPKA